MVQTHSSAGSRPESTTADEIRSSIVAEETKLSSLRARQAQAGQEDANEIDVRTVTIMVLSVHFALYLGISEKYIVSSSIKRLVFRGEYRDHPHRYPLPRHQIIMRRHRYCSKRIVLIILVLVLVRML